MTHAEYVALVERGRSHGDVSPARLIAGAIETESYFGEREREAMDVYFTNELAFRAADMAVAADAEAYMGEEDYGTPEKPAYAEGDLGRGPGSLDDLFDEYFDAMDRLEAAPEVTKGVIGDVAVINKETLEVLHEAGMPYAQDLLQLKQSVLSYMGDNPAGNYSADGRYITSNGFVDVVLSKKFSADEIAEVYNELEDKLNNPGLYAERTCLVDANAHRVLREMDDLCDKIPNITEYRTESLTMTMKDSGYFNNFYMAYDDTLTPFEPHDIKRLQGAAVDAIKGSRSHQELQDVMSDMMRVEFLMSRHGYGHVNMGTDEAIKAISDGFGAGSAKAFRQMQDNALTDYLDGVRQRMKPNEKLRRPTLVLQACVREGKSLGFNGRDQIDLWFKEKMDGIKSDLEAMNGYAYADEAKRAELDKIDTNFAGRTHGLFREYESAGAIYNDPSNRVNDVTASRNAGVGKAHAFVSPDVRRQLLDEGLPITVLHEHANPFDFVDDVKALPGNRRFTPYDQHYFGEACDKLISEGRPFDEVLDRFMTAQEDYNNHIGKPEGASRIEESLLDQEHWEKIGLLDKFPQRAEAMGYHKGQYDHRALEESRQIEVMGEERLRKLDLEVQGFDYSQEDGLEEGMGVN